MRLPARTAVIGVLAAILASTVLTRAEWPPAKGPLLTRWAKDGVPGPTACGIDPTEYKLTCATGQVCR